MRLPNVRAREQLGFNMTPMIDVVFLLIIFFLLSSHLARQEVQLELDLPTADSGSEPTEKRTPRVTVNVLPTGVVYLGGVPVDAEELTRRLRVETHRTGGHLEVRVRSDRGVPYRQIEPIMIACARAGAWNVSFAVTRRGR